MATSRQAVACYFRRLSEASYLAAPADRTDVGPARANNRVEQALDRLGF